MTAADEARRQYILSVTHDIPSIREVIDYHKGLWQVLGRIRCLQFLDPLLLLGQNLQQSGFVPFTVEASGLQAFSEISHHVPRRVNVHGR